MINFTKKVGLILSLFFLFLSNYRCTETSLTENSQESIPNTENSQESIPNKSSTNSETNNKPNSVFDINTNIPKEKSSYSKDVLTYILIGSLSLLIIISIIVWKTCFSNKPITQEEEGRKIVTEKDDQGKSGAGTEKEGGKDENDQEKSGAGTAVPVSEQEAEAERKRKKEQEENIHANSEHQLEEQIKKQEKEIDELVNDIFNEDTFQDIPIENNIQKIPNFYNFNFKNDKINFIDLIIISPKKKGNLYIKLFHNNIEFYYKKNNNDAFKINLPIKPKPTEITKIDNIELIKQILDSYNNKDKDKSVLINFLKLLLEEYKNESPQKINIQKINIDLLTFIKNKKDHLNQSLDNNKKK